MTNPVPGNKITQLDGIRLHQAIITGILEVISRQDYLNRINVFPVPDRDTGTNMALTLNTIIEETPDYPPTHVGTMLAQVADAALNGSRGNSGAILAQFFQGLSDSTKSLEVLTPSDFAKAIQTGTTLAYEALCEPKEGTILTILTTLASSLTKQAEQGADDFRAVLHQSLQDCQQACLQTAQGLKEMRRAKVVDAGAQGFVDFLHGLEQFIRKGRSAGFYQALSPQPIDEVEETVSEYLDSDYRYCTECLIIGEDINQGELRKLLSKDTDSLIVAGSKTKTKIHVHTNAPQKVFDLCAKYGKISNNKADDMIAQQQHINHKRAHIAIVTDSGADIPQELLDELDIHIIPLSINFGTKSYIDKVSLNTEEFFSLLQNSPNHPSSSQPSFSEFHRIYQYLNSHHESIISIHLSSAVSGTLTGSKTAAKRIHNHRITNIDSKSLSGGLGMIVVAAALASKENKTHNQVLKTIEYAIAHTQFYSFIPDLTCLVKGGRLSALKKRLLDFLGLCPIVNTKKTNATVGVCGVVFGRKNSAKKFSRFIAKKIQKGKSYRAFFLYANNLAAGQTLQQLTLQLCPQIKEHYLTSCGALIGVYGGPSAIAVALMELPE